MRAARLGSQKEETCRPGTLGAPRAPYCSCLSPWGFLQGTGGGGKRGALQVPGASTSLVCVQPDLLSPHQEVTVTGSLGSQAGWGSWSWEGGPGLTIGGMAAARCFSCFRSNGFWGEAWVLASLVGVRRLGRGDRSLAVGGHGGRVEDGETSVRPMGSQPLLAPAWMMWLVGGWAARGRRTSRAGETWGRDGGFSLPPLLHARNQDPSHPSPEDQMILRWPRARKVPEKPILRAHTTLGPWEAAGKPKNQPD